MLSNHTVSHLQIDPGASLWASVNARPLRRVALDPDATADLGTEQRMLDLAQLWRDIQDLPANEVDVGLTHLLKRLCQLLMADALHWELLSSPRPGRSVSVAAHTWQHRAELVDATRASGPTLTLTLPTHSKLRMHFTLVRVAGSDDFSPHDRLLLELALAGLARWLNWLALSHGPSSSAGPLPPHQRKVLLLLVTGRSEKQIAAELNLSTNTAHQYVTALYRRYGVRNRPSLAAYWLGAV